jgi:hypothetical protein
VKDIGIVDDTLTWGQGRLHEVVEGRGEVCAFVKFEIKVFKVWGRFTYLRQSTGNKRVVLVELLKS